MNPKHIFTTFILSSVYSFITRTGNNLFRNTKTITGLRLNNLIRKIHSDDLSPSSNNADDYQFIERQKRLILMKKNKLKNMEPDAIPCAYCEGEGYLECNKCEQGCWRCNHTGLEKCPFCDGSGDGKLCLIPISM